MKTKLFVQSMLATLAISLVLAATAETQIEISVSDGDFEMINADVSHLAIGESEILYADDKEITLTRTDSGIEVLVDGEELGSNMADLQTECNVEMNVEVHCEDCDADSEEMNVFLMKTSTDAENMQLNCFSDSGDTQHKIIMIKHVEVVNEEG